MRDVIIPPSILAVVTILLGASAAADVRKVPYPKITVEIAKAYQPDPAFEEMRKAFANAVALKDTNALFALLAPSFVWTVGGVLAGDFDPGRDALHNFKVLFGFRQYGKDVDGGVDDGPFWTSLAAFSGESTFYQTAEDGVLVCSPIAASVADTEMFDEARGKVDTDDEAAEWYFALRDNTPVARAPDDKGLPVARLGQEAVPVLRAHPLAPEGQPAVAPTHFEVLLPSGRSGWIPAAAALPLDTGRLCYVAAPGGVWKIAIYDAAE